MLICTVQSTENLSPAWKPQCLLVDPSLRMAVLRNGVRSLLSCCFFFCITGVIRCSGGVCWFVYPCVCLPTSLNYSESAFTALLYMSDVRVATKSRLWFYSSSIRTQATIRLFTFFRHVVVFVSALLPACIILRNSTSALPIHTEENV